MPGAVVVAGAKTLTTRGGCSGQRNDAPKSTNKPGAAPINRALWQFLPSQRDPHMVVGHSDVVNLLIERSDVTRSCVENMYLEEVSGGGIG